MKYRIGEVSKYLNLSDQMIRYYEKCGVISPERSGDGKYRLYSDMEVFFLFDAMRYKEWGIAIKDIKNIIEDQYFEKILESIDKFEKKLKSEIDYKNLLLSRMGELKKQIVLARYNVGNYWVEEVDDQCWIYSGRARGDCYSIKEGDAVFPYMVYQAEYISFFDILVEFVEDDAEGERENWWYAIKEKYYLALAMGGERMEVKKQYCLCTIVDMGEIGEFNNLCTEALIAYADEKGMERAGKPFGMIVGRGKEHGKFCRLMKLFLPIKNL